MHRIAVTTTDGRRLRGPLIEDDEDQQGSFDRFTTVVQNGDLPDWLDGVGVEDVASWGVIPGPRYRPRFARPSGKGAVKATVAVWPDPARRSMPMARSAVLLGRTTADLVRNVLIIGLMVVVGYLVGFRFQAGVIPALACVALVAAFGFALSWIFAFVSLVVRGAETAQTAGFVLLFPLVFASSVFVPVTTLPNWLQPIAKASPVTLTADAARTLALTGGVPDSLGGALGWIVGIVALFVPLSVWRYRRMS